MGVFQWTSELDVTKSPQANGYFPHPPDTDATVTIVDTGSPATRRYEIDAQLGDVAYQTSSLPSLDSAAGATAEMVVQVSSVAGDIGMEATFLDRAMGINVFADKITVDIAADAPNEPQHHEVATASNSAADVTVRLVYDASGSTLRVYRNAVLLGTYTCQAAARDYQRLLWWAEGGGVHVLRALRFYLGGPVNP